LFTAVEIARVHVRDVGFGVGGPGTHLVRVLAGVVLHRQRGAALGVAFAQHRVHGAALDLVVAGLDVLLAVAGRRFRVVGQGVALVLQLLDGGLQLRDRGADVGQLDDVGVGSGGQLAQLGQVVGDALFGAEKIGEGGEDASGEGNVACFYLDAGGLGERLDDRKQGVGG